MTDPDLAILTVDGASVDRPHGARWSPRRRAALRHRTWSVVVRFTGRLDRPAVRRGHRHQPVAPARSGAVARRAWTRSCSSALGVQPSRRRSTFCSRPGSTRPGRSRPRHTVVGAHCDHRASSWWRARSTAPRTRVPARGADRQPAVAPRWLVVPPSDAAGLACVGAGAVRYTLDCTALDGGHGTTVILTDHRILPLSWTRDAYYQALAVLPAAPDTIAAHLHWLWQRCDRPGDLWQRSYQANGMVKDWALQADQQLYPVLELLDYRDAAGAWPPATALQAGRSGQATVVGTSPPRRQWAPDQPREPRRRPDRAAPPAVDADPLLARGPTTCGAGRRAWSRRPRPHDRGVAVRAAVLDGFAVDGPLGDQWAYAIDGHGNHRLYHDANELPVALAPASSSSPPPTPCCRRRRASPSHQRTRRTSTVPSAVSLGAHSGRVATRRRAGMGVGVAHRRRPTRRVLRHQAGCHRRRRRAAARDVRSVDGRWLSRRWFAWPGSAVAAIASGAFG